ncbi:unnamed protein product, partial [Oppiella nova]
MIGGSWDYTCRLSRIHRLAFNGTHESLKRLDIRTPIVDNSHNIDGDYDLFKAIHTLESLETLYISDTLLTTIPDSAIQSHTKLVNINFESNPIVRIGSQAFKHLPHLRNLDIRRNKIHDISDNAFPVNDVYSDEKLVIDLTANLLSNGTVGKYAFDAIKRPVDLYLYNEDL